MMGGGSLGEAGWGGAPFARFAQRSAFEWRPSPVLRSEVGGGSSGEASVSLENGVSAARDRPFSRKAS
jgi:hypothetical protein